MTKGTKGILEKKWEWEGGNSDLGAESGRVRKMGRWESGKPTGVLARRRREICIFTPF